ncbi:hypothetical protein NDU88_009186 [Pleurodeles waltl]|uniref:Uncharacterized protein n=1 Tax=Pleurodeles waltl TaxID=8319 RepID=A0AAV7QWV6_PLEWA|nr:hypothetical protein NDU88_009186 [Pleurodeles waltl]
MARGSTRHSDRIGLPLEGSGGVGSLIGEEDARRQLNCAQLNGEPSHRYRRQAGLMGKPIYRSGKRRDVSLGKLISTHDCAIIAPEVPLVGDEAYDSAVNTDWMMV